MAEEIDDSLLETDRWGRMLALFAALIAYFALSLALSDAVLGLLGAAFVGIGVRIYIQYHVSRANAETEGTALAEHPMTGNYHYGAVGGALVIGPLFTAVLALLEPNIVLVLSVGALVMILTFAVLQFALPK